MNTQNKHKLVLEEFSTNKTNKPYYYFVGMTDSNGIDYECLDIIKISKGKII